MGKKLSILFLGITLLSITCALTRVYGEEKNQILIEHTFSEDPVENISYELNGFIYKLIDDTFYASLIEEQPQNIEMIVMYYKLYDKNVSYINIESLSSYPNLADMIIYSLNETAENMVKDLRLVNLYIARGNKLPLYYETLVIENYHFVAPYEEKATQLDLPNSCKIDNLTLDEIYYYEFTKPFFEQIAEAYNNRIIKKYYFKLLSDDKLKYAKESFYPCADYKWKLAKQGIEYHHYVDNESFGPHLVSNQQIPYLASKIDQRVVSASIPLLSSTNFSSAIYDHQFKSLDLRHQSHYAIKKFAPCDLIVATSEISFNPDDFNCEELYLVSNAELRPVIYVSGQGTNIKKIYIPSDDSNLYQMLVVNSDFGSKVEYYSGEPPVVEFEFYSEDYQHIYKSSDDYIDIETTLDSLNKLEELGILPTAEDKYINEFVEQQGYPTSSQKDPLDYLEMLRSVNLNRGLDPRAFYKIVEEQMEFISGLEVTIKYLNMNYNFKEDFQITLSVAIGDEYPRQRSFPINYFDFGVDVAFMRTDYTVSMMIYPQVEKTLPEIFAQYANEVLYDVEAKLFDGDEISLLEGNSVTSYTSRGETLQLCIYVTNALRNDVVDYHVANEFLFTSNIDIEKSLEILKNHLVFANGLSTNLATVEISVETSSLIKIFGTYPNGEHFSGYATYSVIESNVGEYIIIRQKEINTYLLVVEARTIRVDITAKEIYNQYFAGIGKPTYSDLYQLPITLVKPGFISEYATNDYKDAVTTNVLVIKDDLNHDGFVDPYNTKKDEYGSFNPIIDEINNKPALKVLISIAAVGLLSTIGYYGYLGTKKTLQWAKNE